jgi:putative Holliday junction resolvase
MIFLTKKDLMAAIPANGRLVALDVGTKRIGIALSDDSRFIATPKMVLNRQSNLKDFAKIAEFISSNQACAAIIGLPLNDDEIGNRMNEFIKKFSENFDEFLGRKFPILFFDERLSSFEAREFNASELSRKNNRFIDDIAASVILQHFLDS